MTRILFYDTETTNLPAFSKPSSDPAQPHILQVAALLVESDTRKVIQSIYLTVRPDGWTIDPHAEAVHGISAERATEVGIPEATALQVLHEIWLRADVRVGHVESYDARIIRIALKRFGWGDSIADQWKAGRAECTAALSRPNVPTKSKTGPKLGDAYRHFTGHDLVDAHSARADTEACMAVYFAVQDLHPTKERRRG